MFIVSGGILNEVVSILCAFGGADSRDIPQALKHRPQVAESPVQESALTAYLQILRIRGDNSKTTSRLVSGKPGNV